MAASGTASALAGSVGRSAAPVPPHRLDGWLAQRAEDGPAPRNARCTAPSRAPLRPSRRGSSAAGRPWSLTAPGPRSSAAPAGGVYHATRPVRPALLLELAERFPPDPAWSSAPTKPPPAPAQDPREVWADTEPWRDEEDRYEALHRFDDALCWPFAPSGARSWHSCFPSARKSCRME